MNGAQIDLLALPCAGGSANMYHRWRHLLPSWVRVVPVELPGRGARMSEPFATDIDQLVERLCIEHAQSLRGRHALFGHSMGALLAHRMALWQRDAGGSLPRALFVSASPSPWCRHVRKSVQLTSDADLTDELRRQGGTAEEVLNNAELRQMVVETFRADQALCASHRHLVRPPLPIPIHVLGGRDDALAASEQADWRRETSDAASVYWFDGGHFFIRQHEVAVAALIVKELLRQLPDAARAEGASTLVEEKHA
ncbi:thioesterase II family protein [Aquabacterium parvum]|jgi:surfactin synthase thioesterase subunit|uniref:thioesterase II family protein n=1 Tax=Aquabacterium parvum TaxID=70584 RepID=UPI000718DFCF|nr:alpha/beta fold hydrolase [Aquabacterium parvum]MBU0915959.1 alpha/beta fold hydrolase [Gammaproteobacteria bacterium]